MRTLAALIVLFALACDDGGGDAPPLTVPDAQAAGDAGPAADGSTQGPADGATAPSLRVDVAREPAEGLDRVVLTVRWSGEGEPMVTAPDADVGPIVPVEPGVATCTLMPRQTGELPFTVQADGQRHERTALVLHAVAEGWGQPMAVPGLVNTPGYEDGITITPDGEYLFVQYGPAYFSGFFVFGVPRDQGGCGGDRLAPTRCDHPWIDETIGPVDAPARPGFPTGRIRDGRWRHNSALYQVPDEGAPNFAVSTIFYGFKRQPDGRFTDPFPVAFEDGDDGIVSPFGLSFQVQGDGTATTLFALNDLADGPTVTADGARLESGFDVYATQIQLGQPNTLGTYAPGAAPLAIERRDFPPQKLPFGDTGWDGVAGTQGNPHLHVVDGLPHSVWTDDEYDRDPASPTSADHEDLAVYVADTWPDGPWTKVVLPAPVRGDGVEIQPTFTGRELFFTKDYDVAVADYTGPQTAAGYGDAANWAPPRRILARDPGPVANVTAVGEPTVATVDGVQVLYFVYGVVRGTDPRTGFPDINMQAGVVTRAP